MSPPAAELFTYVWHYVVARLLYDELFRPLARGRAGAVLFVVVCVAAAVFVLRRRRRIR
jgi:hypothetical protein